MALSYPYPGLGLEVDAFGGPCLGKLGNDDARWKKCYNVDIG